MKEKKADRNKNGWMDVGIMEVDEVKDQEKSKKYNLLWGEIKITSPSKLSTSMTETSFDIFSLRESNWLGSQRSATPWKKERERKREMD